MSYSEIYTRINWKNEPDTSTPLDADDLNHMDAALKAFDLLIKEIGNNAMVAADVANCLYGQPTLNQSTGVITFPKKDGGAYTLDTLLEKVVVNFDWDPVTQKLTITLQDGTTKEVDLSALIQENEFLDSDTIVYTITGHKVKSDIKAHSIGANELETNYLASCESAVTNAEAAEDNAEGYALDAEAWAKGTRDGEPVGQADPTSNNNAKYYSQHAREEAEAWAKGTRNNVPIEPSDPAYNQHAKYYAQHAREEAEAWAVGERGGVPVTSSDETYDNNSKYYCDEAKSYSQTAEDAADDAEAALAEINTKIGATVFTINLTTGELEYTSSGYTFSVNHTTGNLEWEVAS